MFNRNLYQKLQTEMTDRSKLVEYENLLKRKRKSQIQVFSKNYKAKVRNFLVELASNPLSLGQYAPPLQLIERTKSKKNLLGASQMLINGFKTNKQRVKQAQNRNKIYDSSPTKVPLRSHSFRQRNLEKQIQPHLHFSESLSGLLSVKTRMKSFQNEKYFDSKNKSMKSLKLPSIVDAQANPERKTYFKAIEEMGNSLKTMQPTKSERRGVQNRLMVVLDGKQVQIESTAFDLLVKSNILRKKTNSQRALKSFNQMKIG